MIEQERAGVHASSHPASPLEVRFDRRELNLILDLYGHGVAQGDWRDYTISFSKDTAVFAIHRRTSEMPLYRIEKRPKFKDRQGAFAVIAPGGQILKRGHELAQVLKVFDKKRLSVVG